MATKKETIVELKPIEIKETTITIKGDTPLIVNNFNEKTKQQILDTQMKKAKSEAREPKNPVESFMRSLNWLYEEIRMREDMVRVGMGSPDIRHRAEFIGWSMTFPIKYVENTYSLEQIINFFNIGGFGVGLGESRVEKGGTNGSYHVVAN